jgi:hypothetical protein
MKIEVPSDDPVEWLISQLALRFKADGHTTSVVGGRQARARQNNQGGNTANRIVIFHGNKSGSGGKWGNTFGPGGNPAAIGSYDMILTAACWAVDPKNPTDEFSSKKAARLLFNEFAHRMNLLFAGTYLGIDTEWTDEPNELSHGAELLATFVLRTKLLSPIDEVGMLDVALTPEFSS